MGRIQKKIDYRKEKVKLVRNMIFILTYFLTTFHTSKIDKLSYAFLRQTEEAFRNQLSEVNELDRYMHERYISANGIDATATDNTRSNDLRGVEK